MRDLRPEERILVALDTPQSERAADLMDRCGNEVGGFKLGLEFFIAQGPQGVLALPRPKRLFLDLKLHDIPNTVAGALRSAIACLPTMITIHAAGGRAMMQAALAAATEAAQSAGQARPKILAVTVLTSLDDDDLVSVGQAAGGSLSDHVVCLAKLAQSAGLDGVICSPREIENLRRACGDDFLLVVPGIRPASGIAQDQKRVATPALAVSLGADYLVIGRPITGADSPAEACRAIAREIATVTT